MNATLLSARSESVNELTAPTLRDRRVENPAVSFGPRRGVYINAAERLAEEGEPLDERTLECCDQFDLFYRTLCAVMYNYAPLSGHPGGSISSGRFVSRLLFDIMDYDLSRPYRRDADIISYAAGHKALGLYAMWALRNEIAASPPPICFPTTKNFNCAWKIYSVLDATLQPQLRCSNSSGPNPSMVIPRRRLRSLGFPPVHPVLGFRPRSVWPGRQPTYSGRMRRVYIL